MGEDKEETEGATGVEFEGAGVVEAGGERAGVEGEVAAAGEETRASFFVRQGWMMLALLLLAAAGVALALSHTDAAFVLGALGVCAWFLNLRGELKRKHGLKKTGRRNWEAR